MRHPAGKLAHRLHLLRLAQLLLQRLPLSDVHPRSDDLDRCALGIAYQPLLVSQPTVLFVLVPNPVIPSDLFFPQKLGGTVHDALAVLRMKLAEQAVWPVAFSRRVAQQPFDVVAHPGRLGLFAIGFQRIDYRRALGKQMPEPLLSVLPPLLHPETVERTAAMIGQRLQRFQAIGVVGPGCVALD